MVLEVGLDLAVYLPAGVGRELRPRGKTGRAGKINLEWRPEMGFGWGLLARAWDPKTKAHKAKVRSLLFSCGRWGAVGIEKPKLSLRKGVWTILQRMLLKGIFSAMFPCMSKVLRLVIWHWYRVLGVNLYSAWLSYPLLGCCFSTILNKAVINIFECSKARVCWAHTLF